jgi:DNA polymerase III delta' subunit
MALTFEDILGQGHAVETLRSAYESERLPHALLFAGPAGVGKGTTAEALGALFLCEKPKNTKPCGRCESCRLMESKTHPDFHRIYKELIRLEKEDSKARDLSIDVLRTHFVAPASLKPAMGVGKVFLIEQADDMNAAGQNAILKTLEEPYGRTLIILLAEQPGSLLPTIRSRCQVVLFAPLPEKVVLEELKKRGLAASVASNAAHFSLGSLGMALRWQSDNVIDTAAQLSDHLDALLNGQAPDHLQDFFKKSAEAYAAKQIERDKLTSKDQSTRDGLAIYLKIAAQILRAKLKDKSDPDRLEQICQAIETLALSESYIYANVSMALIYQQLAMSLENKLAANVALS